jgi:hypothetical protein
MAEVDDRSIEEEPEHPLVARLRPDPVGPAEPTVTFTGLLGFSESDAKRRLYFSSELECYVEFRVEDVLHHENIRAEDSPIEGLSATSIIISSNALVDYICGPCSAGADDFDLDVKVDVPVGRTRGGVQVEAVRSGAVTRLPHHNHRLPGRGFRP